MPAGELDAFDARHARVLHGAHADEPVELVDADGIAWEATFDGPTSVAVLGESLGSMASNLAAGPGKLAVGVDINATHTRSATSGIVTGVCTPIHLGRSVMVHEIVVTDDEGRRCSTVRITNLIRDLER